MSHYQGATVHVDRPLSQFALAYENHELIADKVLPVVLSAKKSDSYFIRDRDNQIRAADPKIGLLDVPPEVEGGITTATFTCQNYGYTAKTAIETERNADVPLNVRQDAAMDCMAQLMLAREVRAASTLTTSGNYDSGNVQTLSGAAQWNAATGSGDPFGVIETARASVWPAPNSRKVMGCGYEVWKQMKNHPALLDRLKYGGSSMDPAKSLRAKIAELFEVDEFVVGEAWKNAANPGAADSVARVWGKSLFIVAVPNYPSPRAMGFAQTFRWTEPGPGGIAVTSWFEPGPGLLGVQKHKITHSDVEKVVAAEAGALVASAVA